MDVRVPAGAVELEGVPEISPSPRGATLLLTQDWHPRWHVSFDSSHPGKMPFDKVRLHPALSLPHAQLEADGRTRDCCVEWTAVDARDAGFEVTILEEACRGIGS